MSYLIEILVRRKKGVLDPEAMVISNAIKQLGYNVENFGQAKLFYYVSKQETEVDAKKEAKELSDKLLTNPIIERFDIISIKEKN